MRLTPGNQQGRGIQIPVKAPGMGWLEAAGALVLDTRNFPYFTLWMPNMPVPSLKILVWKINPAGNRDTPLVILRCLNGFLTSLEENAGRLARQGNILYVPIRNLPGEKGWHQLTGSEIQAQHPHPFFFLQHLRMGYLGFPEDFKAVIQVKP